MMIGSTFCVKLCLRRVTALSSAFRNVSIVTTQRSALLKRHSSGSSVLPHKLPVYRLVYAKAHSSSNPPPPNTDGTAAFMAADNEAENTCEETSGYTFEDWSAHFGVEESEMVELCEQALEGAIAEVPRLGWSRTAVASACLRLGLPGGLHSVAMPRGAIDLVLHFYESRNHRLADVLASWRKEATPNHQTQPNSFGFQAPPPFKSKSETDAFLKRAIEFRLKANDEVHPQWRQAMALLSLPQNIPAAIGLEAQLVDEIWAQAGDRSTDMNWYAKRLGLAYVYKLTELFYIQDTSPDHAETWQFLDRRIADLRAMKEAKLKGISNMLREGIFAAGHVTSNILGWNVRGT